MKQANYVLCNCRPWVLANLLLPLNEPTTTKLQFWLSLKGRKVKHKRLYNYVKERNSQIAKNTFENIF